MAPFFSMELGDKPHHFLGESGFHICHLYAHWSVACEKKLLAFWNCQELNLYTSPKLMAGIDDKPFLGQQSLAQAHKILHIIHDNGNSDRIGQPFIYCLSPHPPFFDLFYWGSLFLLDIVLGSAHVHSLMTRPGV